MYITGKVVMKLTGHEKKVTDVSFHPDAKISTILTASADKTVKLWKDGTLYTVRKRVYYMVLVYGIMIIR